jgi:sulfite reductase (NADPH) flavoprotein alpha-component
MATTARNAIFQLHWCFGITAGLVLAIVGVTGGMLSFEDALLRALNPGVMTVQPRDTPLAPAALLERVRGQRPGERIASLQLSADPRDAAVVGFAARDGGRRGERWHVDPYTGTLLDAPRYQDFFRTTMRLHRWLVADDVGKQVVGASTVILVFFCLSGLYLRWPRRRGSLRTWFALDWRQKGRNFLWHLHAIVGTWALLAYLVMALTGLWWSYGWYRDAVNDWATGGKPRQEAPAAASGRGDPPPFDIDAAWQAFTDAAPAWSSATIALPKDDQPVSVRYLDADPAHERARNELALDRWTLQPVAHERYDEGSWRQKIGASMFALHRGSFFGTGGVVAFMVASFAMPLFAVTGWMLYLDRRRRRRVVRDVAGAIAAGPASAAPQSAVEDDPALLVLHASQTGTAEALALRTAASLREAGCPAEARGLGSLAPSELALRRRVLFVVATYGDGDAPDAARAFARALRDTPPALPDLQYAVLALGDSDYDDSFCGFGRELDDRLRRTGARPLFDRVEVDNEDPAALRHWQHQLALFGDRSDIADWRPPDYRAWRLADRRLLNRGSVGGEAWLVELVPEDPADLRWQAGDVAEIGPRATAGNAATDAGGAPLPSREYSIASVPEDGRLQLIVRRMTYPDGRPGLGSGWLTCGVDIGGRVDLRVRANPGFRAPRDDRPVLLVGNGTGLAGLRALLKARIAAGHRRNWLLFGERSAAHDGFHSEELEAWRRQGDLQRLDLVFSRDQPERRYVQHALADAAEEVRRWIAEGAAIYVCGSLRGMASGVDETLERILGRATLDAMAADGRYRRDVY